MKPFFTALIGWVALNGTAMAQTPQAQPPSVVSAKPTGPQKDRFGDAVIAPLGDLNLNQTPIPPILLDAALSPYLAPPVITCDTLAAAIAPLDEALGTDLDTPPTPLNQGLPERGSVLAGDAAISRRLYQSDAADDLTRLRVWWRGRV